MNSLACLWLVFLDENKDFKFWDSLTGELYSYTDWHAQSNFMAPDLSGKLLLWKIGIFKYNYEPVFDQILECWFQRSYERDPAAPLEAPEEDDLRDYDV